ncbi:hypothetical protein [Tepidimicrobium xylanilyticum]|uniref:Energy-coupling factor transport system substrate-specific component n=1 Tax=Tepidimicrobium xylanilyticum TaxID=1123352 RepID=A0A1H2V628_9FIRM|nr:hypothetical protein [Tepidimicrobium xylanilyticum]GMG96719.1 hypothetical protein EN5CB1_15450 [Tepidimicrobium xylanilyticum]SDW63773.1 energy-coupling factor transport system substrate-specific component [Tepidimicrobium xylanilyticum]
MKIRDIALIGILSATITAGKLVLSFIPNIEIVTLLFIAYTIVFGYKKVLLISVVFTTTEIFIYGFATWLLVYYIIWPILIIITELLKRRVKSEYGYAIIGAIFGYTFGIFFSVVESFFYGAAYGWAYWVRGLLFDLIHGTSNFIIVLVLLKPILDILNRLKKTYYRT